MASLCGRPGCSEAGTVAYGMDPTDLVFWVASIDQAASHDDHVLCRRHADAMVVPRGWTLDDRRATVEVTNPLDVTPPTPESPDAESPESAESADADGASWRPEFDHDDDLDGLLEVSSPLLSRAFRGTDRPRG